MNPGDWIGWKRSGFGDYPRIYMVYDANNNLTFIGLAPRGSATSASVWVIRQYFYDANNNMYDQKTSKEGAVMDNYLTETYG